MSGRLSLSTDPNQHKALLMTIRDTSKKADRDGPTLGRARASQCCLLRCPPGTAMRSGWGKSGIVTSKVEGRCLEVGGGLVFTFGHTGRKLPSLNSIIQSAKSHKSTNSIFFCNKPSRWIHVHLTKLSFDEKCLLYFPASKPHQNFARRSGQPFLTGAH